jgi:hypothetical protein
LLENGSDEIGAAAGTTSTGGAQTILRHLSEHVPFTNTSKTN